MRRALLLAGALLAALALFWLATRLDSASRPDLPARDESASPVPLASAGERIESEAAAAAIEDKSSAAPTRVQQPAASAQASPTLAGPKSEVIGRVVKVRTGEPVHAGEVLLHFTLAAVDTGREGLDLASLSSPIDKEGRFRFEAPIGANLYSVAVSPFPPDGEGPRRASTGASIEFAPRSQLIEKKLGPEGRELLVEVEGTSELHGIVRDARTRAPLEGVRLRIQDGHLVPDVHTEADGRFTVIGIPPLLRRRAHKLQVERRDYLPQSIALGPTELAADAAPLVVELARGLVVAGRVVDAGNRPLSGVALNFRALGIEAGVDLGASALATRTDERGEFRLTALPPCATLFVELQAQTCDGRELLPMQRDLGPLRADRTGLELDVQSCGLLEVRAELADGTPLEPRAFQLVCTGPQAVEAAGSSAEGRLLRAPIGVDLELEAYTTGRDEQDTAVYLRGRQTVRLDGNGTLQLRIVLAQRGRLAAPPAREGVREFVLPGVDYLRSTLDVQLVDARTGKPVVIERYLSIACSGGSMMARSLEGGWLRVRGPPGKHRLEAEIDGGTHEVLEVVLPVSGYGTMEWRVGAGK
jgi:hypothetical protein